MAGFTVLQFDHPIILASASPRRRKIFENLGIEFQSIPSNFKEDYDKEKYTSAESYCLATAKAKAEDVFSRNVKDNKTNSIVISADTIVVNENQKILEKPKDKKHAKEMLRDISGKTITIITAVCVFYRGCGDQEQVKIHSFSEKTIAEIDDLDERLITLYINLGNGMDNSAALAYQDAACGMIKGITGCYYNMIGFPINRFLRESIKIGLGNISE